MIEPELKNSFRNSAKRALLGNTNTSIRAIGVTTDGIKLIVKCYTDRIPTEEDYDSLNDISGEIISDFYYNDLEEICEFSAKPIPELERIDDMVLVTPWQPQPI